MDTLESGLSTALRKSDAEIGDAGFSDAVMRALPPGRRFASARGRRWTLAGAAAVGAVTTVLLGAPVGNAFDLLAWGGGHLTSVAVLGLAAVVAATTFWAFFSE